jgi:hypothetical protein
MRDNPGIEDGENAVRVLDHEQSLVDLDKLRAVGKIEQALCQYSLMYKGRGENIQVEKSETLPKQPEFVFFPDKKGIWQHHYSDDGYVVMMGVTVVNQSIKGPANGAAKYGPSMSAEGGPAIHRKAQQRNVENPCCDSVARQQVWKVRKMI